MSIELALSFTFLFLALHLLSSNTTKGVRLSGTPFVLHSN